MGLSGPIIFAGLWSLNSHSLSMFIPDEENYLKLICCEWLWPQDLYIYPKKCWVKLDHKTPPKNNLDPENKPVWKDHHFARLHFLGWIFVFRGVVVFSWFIYPLLQLVGKPPRPHCSIAWWPGWSDNSFCHHDLCPSCPMPHGVTISWDVTCTAIIQ